MNWIIEHMIGDLRGRFDVLIPGEKFGAQELKGKKDRMVDNLK